MVVKDYKDLKFYNYIPVNKELKKSCVPCPDTEDFEAKLNQEFEEQVKNAFQGNVLDRIDAKNINADLKRDLNKKLKILSKKTDKAIIELVKRKINENKSRRGEGSSNDNYENDDRDKQNEISNTTLNFNQNEDDMNYGRLLHQALDKMDIMDDSD
ncbi:pre-mRNA-splicing factor CWF18 [Plasmodium gonderi]|uniref:Pre-mRNA-splicing factor CWF18 n=1 Tax=Plasmodium gonderi TaxID=77519 RepID=A0A1Y1JNZ6_PLAGO|nr:pre-mRNA-splicing factor CWF18 [Plasmodium gonderi]GAW82572.1 pre-mRNA-splicing factor CWF18 [Plasmodium gonderi]